MVTCSVHKILYFDFTDKYIENRMPGARKSSSFSCLSIPVNKSNHSMRSPTQINPSYDEWKMKVDGLKMKMLNEAALRSARKVIVEANKKARNYYNLTFIDDDNDESKEELKVNPAEDTLNATSIENESINNSKFAFEDDEGWLGSRKPSKVDEDILNNNKAIDKASSNAQSDVTSRQNVVEVLAFQSEQ